MKKIGLILGITIIVLAIAAYFVAYLPYTRIKAKGEILVASAREMKDVFKANDMDLLKNKTAEVRTEYNDFKKESQSVYWATFIPYVADFKNAVEAGDYVLKAGEESINAIEPYADLIGFKKGESSFVDRPAEERLQTAIATLDKVLVKVDTISEDIKQAEDRIAKIDPNRYPEKVGNTVVRDRIANLRQQFDGYASLFVDAKPLVKKLPEIFGSKEEQTYLLLFQNQYEQRATGGFLTAFATFKMKGGKITIDRSSDIYTLDDSIGTHPAAPEKVLAYHKNVSKFFVRDSNLSPDLVESIKLFDSLYQKSGIRQEYDGIIMMDAKILVDMLTIFGDTEAGGVRFSANEDKRCDCPQVIYTLFDMVDRPVGYVRENRKGILGDLMYALFYKAIGFSPSKYWGTLVENMFENLEQKHMLVYFSDPETQAAVEKVNFAGRIKETKGDYLHVNNVNFAGAKSNLYVTKTISSKTTFNNGQVQREVHVEFRNPYPHSDCNLERGGLCLNATLRDWIRFYVPKGSKLVDFKGSETKTLTYDDLGKTVFEGFLTVSPLGKAEVIVTYTLPQGITEDNYSLMVQKQPGESTLKLNAEIAGAKVYDADFTKDVELKK